MASITAATPAQIVALKSGLIAAEKGVFSFDLVHNPGVAPVVDAALAQASAALTPFASTPSNVASITSGGTVPVKNSAGTSIDAAAVVTVASNVVTGVALASTIAAVANGASVNVTNSAGTAVPGTETAVVAAGVLTSVALPATAAVVNQADANVVVQNSAGAAITSAGVAAVASGVLSNVKLPATIAAVANATKYNAVSVTGSGNFATFTVAAGVITAIVLSAS